jgi:hypothetical protein
MRDQLAKWASHIIRHSTGQDVDNYYLLHYV